MDQYITITSKHDNPAKFSCSVLDALNVDEGYEVAVMRIFHAPLFNVTTRNNKFTIIKSVPVDGVKFLNRVVDFYIPPAFYAGSCDILAAIYNEMKNSLERGSNGHGADILITKAPTFAYAKNIGESSTLKIMDTNVGFLINTVRDGDQMLLSMLGYCVDDVLEKLTINHYKFEMASEPGFLYSNIVENSFINQQQSRLLSIFPVCSKRGYNYFEFKNPIYCKLSAHSFIDVNFELTDVHGETMEMDPVHTTSYGSNTVIYPTIITLHMRKIV